ncbi:HET domain containing protein [Curvularia clavata]|uniref:HET domain containing protein n=1 Tax=Curvularia clavata TaxID=95742 RepID=A0A9Q8ZF02_CURCL|nr:HET domain containing protein [Curvularia clavata]
MASHLPTRLLCQIDGQFSVVNTSETNIKGFDIVSYTWGAPVEKEWECDIPGVDWPLTIREDKLNGIKRLMVTENIKHLWAHCVCTKQTPDADKAIEILTISEYYKNADRCHILLDMPIVWDSQQIVDDLKFVDHIISHIESSALAEGAPGIMADQRMQLQEWEKAPWAFAVPQTTVRAAAIDLGVLNCYSTCINHVRSLLRNPYFTRIETFQEMVLGKNVVVWATDRREILLIGGLDTWMSLAVDCVEKASKLRDWIQKSRRLNNASINAILRVVDEDMLSLERLRLQVQGIESAKTDIINGGPNWWCENNRGIANIFSAVSLISRNAERNEDIFRGLLGIFNGLFTFDEIKTQVAGDDIEKISFNFFKQLSTKTNVAWTKLAISNRERGEWDWIPVFKNYSGPLTTNYFAGVTNLGQLNNNGQAKSTAVVGVKGSPKKYMRIRLIQNSETTGFTFNFRGCNCGKTLKKGMWETEVIPTNHQPRTVVKDETGKMLVRSATILGSLIDPTGDVIRYRKRLLQKLRPNWTITDPKAKPISWEDRCVSGTFWESPAPEFFRSHNMSMNYHMIDINNCESRLWNETTANISCEVRVNCGCTIIAPFALIFEALTAVQGSSLGEIYVGIDNDNRIILRDGLGLVQVGEVGKTFDLLAFTGNMEAYKMHASDCRNLKIDQPVVRKTSWPCGRALVREEFAHGVMDQMRDYGYIETGGSGNLLISRNHLMDQYKIIGVCIDEYIQNEKGRKGVKIR